MHGRIFEQHFQIAHKALLERGTVMALQAKLMVMHERDSLKMHRSHFLSSLVGLGCTRASQANERPSSTEEGPVRRCAYAHKRLVLFDIDRLGIKGNLTASDFSESHGKRLHVIRLGDFDSAGKLDGAIALTTHHVVDIVGALGRQSAQQKAVVVGFVEQDVDFGVDKCSFTIPRTS